MNRFFTTASLLAVSFTAMQASAVSLIGAGIDEGNGDFFYEQGDGVGISGGFGVPSITEVIPRDRAFVGVGNNPGQGLSVNGWSFVRVTYSGANNAFGLDGNFGFDSTSFEPNNTGSGMAFQNGNANATIDLSADQIAFSGAAGDIFDLSYLLGSDSAGGNASVTLTLDAGLVSQQSVTFGTVARSGSARDGSNTITEQYVSTGTYSTVDLNFRLGNESGSTRVLVDDVRLDVTPIPEPSSLALLGLGGLLIARRRRG
ncbi:MAG: PEP-CTERM sorting domain-containing protein [Planctomycetota bacterium]